MLARKTTLFVATTSLAVASAFGPGVTPHAPSTLRGARSARRVAPRMDLWSYTTFHRALQKGAIDAAIIFPDASLRVSQHGETHTTQLIPAQAVEVIQRLADKGVDVSVSGSSGAGALARDLVGLVPWLFIGYVMLSAARSVQMQQKMMQPTKDGVQVVEDSDTRLADVAGLRTAKEEVQEIISFLRDPTRFRESGAKAPKGVLLDGPPGTGKTLLARAVAGEANVAFLPTTASSFVEMYVGLGAARIRSLFAKAKELAPCIVWIDEIDAIGKQRSGGTAGNEERENTLNELLSAMDGFTRSDDVIVLAATNRADILDDALLRPGRFDRRIEVTLPDLEERREILAVHTRERPLAPTVDLDALAAQTAGFSGASLANLVNEASIRMMRRNASAVGEEDVEDALDRVTMGLPRPIHLSPDVQRRVAIHEAGHVVVAHNTPYDAVTRVTIEPRSNGAGGFTRFRPSDDQATSGLLTRDYLAARLAVLLGGQAAERHLLGEETLSTGASADVQQARRQAEDMIASWGLGEAIYGPDLGAAAQDALDDEVGAVLRAATARAREIVREHEDQLRRLTQALVERGTIDGPDIVACLDGE